MASTFTFESPAITATYADATWTVRREGKGDYLTFSVWGGFVYRSGQPEPVGSVYINDGATSESAPYFSFRFTRTCECGHGRIEDSAITTFDTPSQAVEAAAYCWIS